VDHKKHTNVRPKRSGPDNEQMAQGTLCPAYAKKFRGEHREQEFGREDDANVRPMIKILKRIAISPDCYADFLQKNHAGKRQQQTDWPPSCPAAYKTNHIVFRCRRNLCWE
jgi:hypothetical protein